MNRPLIYVIGSFEKMEAIKIGITKRSPHLGRLQQLQTGFPYHLHIYAQFPVHHSHIYKKEKNIHTTLAANRMKGEWFNIHPRTAITVIKEELGIIYKEEWD